MLILGRKVGDSILIEGGIRIVVVSSDRGGVRIGIDAPPELKILRGEIAQQVASENQRATANPSASAWLAALGGPTIDDAVVPVTSLVAPVTAPVVVPS
jgi:carbon storage regulator